MNFAIIGRTRTLLDTAELLIKKGHTLSFVITSKAPKEYLANHLDYELFANKYDAKYVYAPKITSEIIELIKGVDIGIGLNYITLIPQSFIDKFKLGIINAHTGDLPRYKGNAVVAWAMINGEKEVVNTIHYMEGGNLDSGDIILQSKFPLELNTKIAEVYKWFEEQCPQDYLAALEKIFATDGKCGVSQLSTGKKHMRCYPRMPQDGLINWFQDAKSVIRHINASGFPFSGAYSYIEGKKVIFNNVELVEKQEEFSGIPGQVSLINNQEGFIEVLTGNSEKIRVYSFLVGGKEISTNQLINSIRLRFRNQ